VIRHWTEPTGGLFTSNPENGLIDKGAFESGSCLHANSEKRWKRKEEIQEIRLVMAIPTRVVNGGVLIWENRFDAEE
jgi:hypothetical protein